MPWRPEHHQQILMVTDASLFKYGSVILSGTSKGLTFSDFWGADDTRPIHLKEAHAVLQALRSMGTDISDHRVDLLTDNMAVLRSWENQGGKGRQLNDLMKLIFEWVFMKNIDLKMSYVPSISNDADAASRSLSFADSMQAPETWRVVEQTFGPHFVDLMALDSNAMCSASGELLKHFTPFPTPLSAGVNLFAQDLSNVGNCYVFPPFNLCCATLCYLRERCVPFCTLVTPFFQELPVWWPMLEMFSTSRLCLGRKGQLGVILVPTKKGFVPENKGLRWDLYAYRLSFT